MHAQTHILVVKSLLKTGISILMLLMFGSFSVKAQDLLVTVQHDTLNCKMGVMEGDQYAITFVLENEEMKGLIHKDSILFFKKNVFRNLHDDRLRPWYSLVEIGFDAGATHQLGTFRIDDDLTDKGTFGARTGFYLGADLNYYISKGIGYGVKYNYRSLLEGDLFYQYVGPMMTIRFPKKNKSNYLDFSFSCGLGWMVQKNAPIQRYYERPRIEMHAKSLAGDVAVAYHIKCSKHVNLRLKASCQIGYPGFVKIVNITQFVKASDEPLDIGNYCNNMNTIQVTAGFIFH